MRMRGVEKTGASTITVCFKVSYWLPVPFWFLSGCYCHIHYFEQGAFEQTQSLRQEFFSLLQQQRQ
jgi:GTP cyclohydrolase I